MLRARHLGSELVVSEVGLGCMGMSEFYSGHSESMAVPVLLRAVELGITLFDTADFYGPWANEELLGRVLAPVRDRVIIATKVGRTRGPHGEKVINGRPEYIRSACEGSLARLKVETIDLYYLHRVDPDVPIEESIGAMADLVDAGKVRLLGLSEAAPDTICRAHAVHPISALQTEFSLWTREPESELLGLTKELEIGFVAYSPLGRGFLANRFKNQAEIAEDDYRRMSPRFVPGAFELNQDLARSIFEFAAQRNVTPAQLALAWILAQGEHIVPIFGTTSLAHLEENVAAASVALSNTELTELDAQIPKGWPIGGRYPHSTSGTVNL